MANDEAEEVVRRQLRLLDEGDVAGSAATFADPGMNHGMQVARAQVELVLRSLRQALPDMRSEILQMVSDDEAVACRLRITGTHLGTPELPFVEGGVFAMGPPTGLEVSSTHSHWYRVRDGQIVEHWADRDDLGVLRQLGLVRPEDPATRLRLGNITFDCEDVMKVAMFWSAALGRPLDDRSSAVFASIGGRDGARVQPAWYFAKVPEPKSAKNRVHVDLVSADPGVVDELVRLGATVVGAHDVPGGSHRWTVLHDPEGNEFCIADKSFTGWD